MNKKITYCGLNCQTCDAYLATIHNDQKLKEATAKKMSPTQPGSYLAGTHSL